MQSLPVFVIDTIFVDAQVTLKRQVNDGAFLVGRPLVCFPSISRGQLADR